MQEIIPYILGATAIGAVWFLVCNQLTYIQVKKIQCFVFDDLHNNWRILLNDMRTVSYDRHLWTIFTFRNPYKIYPESIRSHFVKK